MAKRGAKPSYAITVQGKLNARYFDFFWAYRKITWTSESELIRESWRKFWDALPESDKKNVERYLEKNPSPRMVDAMNAERINKQKCE